MRKRKIFTQKERRKILDTYGNICYLCNREIDTMQVWHIDHIKAWSKGGSDDIENLRPTHKRCNELKDTRNINLVRLAEAHKGRMGK